MTTHSATTTPKDVVQRFYAAFSANDQAALRSLLAEDLRAYHQGSPTATDLEGLMAMITGWNAAFSTRFEILEQIAEGDSVATRVTMLAVHDRGPFQGRQASGSALSIPALTIERVRDGRIVERHVISDSLGMAQQLAAS